MASPRTDFRRVIVHGENGYLAATPDDWKQALARLIESAELRHQMGQKAFEQVRANESTLVRATLLHETLRSAVPQPPESNEPRLLTINWVLGATSDGYGGGYNSVFRHIDYLGKHGHSIRLYAEPSVRYWGMSASEIRTFIQQHYGEFHGDVYAGHRNILPADVTIATDWSTAVTVNDHNSSDFKVYYIRDFDPELFDDADPRYDEAAKTYDLPLHQMCLGDNLAQIIAAYSGRKPSAIDFTIDDSILGVTRTPLERRETTRILFFATPGVQRKGYEIGIEALRRINAQFPYAEIMTFGSKDEELGILPFPGKNLGVLTQEQMRKTLKDVHILLSLSLSNVSYVTFEAMAFGTAVVEADVPAVRSLFVSEENCLLAKLDPQAVTDAVLRLINDDSLRVRIAAKSAESVTQLASRHAVIQFEEQLQRHCWLSSSTPFHRGMR